MVKGWKSESARHALAAKKIKTGRKKNKKLPRFISIGGKKFKFAKKFDKIRGIEYEIMEKSHKKKGHKESITDAIFVCEECGAEVDYDQLGKHMRAHEAEADIGGLEEDD